MMAHIGLLTGDLHKAVPRWPNAPAIDFSALGVHYTIEYYGSPLLLLGLHSEPIYRPQLLTALRNLIQVKNQKIRTI